ncbi:hypothetical protein ABGB17_17615 [Sphaerisporangium sp. B11E5]|uniref:hypothetical protein n=1 Tax=Sphaerisporangium sp. B11E5 TaxID=3153563 RepID=UPI00325C41A5
MSRPPDREPPGNAGTTMVNGATGYVRALGFGAAGLGGPALAWLAHPLMGAVLVGAESCLALTVAAAALFGSEVISERAFRLLRWIANRPEPSGRPRRR